MQGKWIWFDGPSTENQIGCFSQCFTLQAPEAGAVLNMSADTRYVAHLNGHEVGRGPVRSVKSHWYYDSYDVSPLLRAGQNHLALRVWDYGLSTYQSIALRGGAIFELTLNGKALALSGTQTLATRDAGLKYNTVKRNVNLGFMENYDARLFSQNWLRDASLCAGWKPAVLLDDLWGPLHERPVPAFDVQVKTPRRVLRLCETMPGCQQVSVNTRFAFFPERRDANETIFAGFLGVILEAPDDMEGAICFPNRTWNGILGDFTIGGQPYSVSNEHRDISVKLKRGRQLFLLQISGKYDDLFCHMEFCFPQPIAFKGPEKSGCTFFVIGPTEVLTQKLDGRDQIYGGLDEFDRLEAHNALHERLFSCKGADELRATGEQLQYVGRQYVFFEEYLFSLARTERELSHAPLTQAQGGLLWNNLSPTVIEPPKAGAFQRLIVDFEDLYVGALEFTLCAKAGTILDIYCFENMFEGEIDYTIGLNNGLRYRCGEGLQTYRAVSRMGCRYAMLTLRCQGGAPVLLYSFRLRHAVYPAAGVGSFRCNDALLNRIWEMSRHTHELCREDTFTDCPTYEQAFWIGDAYTSALTNLYLYGEYELIRHNLRMAVTAQENTPLMNALTPTDWNTSIPMWMMNWVLSLGEYVAHTGDHALLRELYPALRRALNCYEAFVDADGAFLISAWNMLDWAAMDIHNHGVVTGQQALLAHCFRLGAGFSQEAGSPEDAERWSAASARMLRYIDSKLWDENRQMFLDGWTPEHGLSKTVSIQTHVLLALFGGISNPEKAALAERYLECPPEVFLKPGSPFILSYLYEAWAKRGRVLAVAEDIKSRWGMMLRYDCTTCWEVFPGFYEVGRTRSYCHSWSTTPAYIAGRYLLGVSIAEEGFRRVVISLPETGLIWCEGSIPTPLGAIQVYWSRENGRRDYRITLPRGIEAQVAEGFDWSVTKQVK